MHRAEAQASNSRGGRRLRVLVALELGGNWGHLLRVKPQIDALRARGHECLLATPDVPAALRLLAGDTVGVRACPLLQRTHPLPAGVRFEHYVQILEHCAFGDEAVLASNVRQWMALVRTVRPDVILADFSPMALLVARLCALPAVQVCTGWEAPPPDAPLPSFGPAAGEGDASFAARESRLLERLNRQCRAHGAAPLPAVGSLYAGPQLLCTWTETDHFGPRPGGRYIGPLFSDGHGVAADWDRTGTGLRPRVFAYLAPDARNPALADALADAGADVVAVLPGLPEVEAIRLRGRGLQVFGSAVRIAPLLREARLAVTNGGHGLVGACLSAGVPMLLSPRNAEQAIVADRLAALGVARRTGGADGFGPEVAQALADNDAVAAARSMAARHGEQPMAAALQAVVAAIEEAGARDGAQR